MAIEIVEKYVNELIDRSTLEEPVWNIEKIRAGKKASWDYIDGCMINVSSRSLRMYIGWIHNLTLLIFTILLIYKKS